MCFLIGSLIPDPHAMQSNIIRIGKDVIVNDRQRVSGTRKMTQKREIKPCFGPVMFTALF